MPSDTELLEELYAALADEDTYMLVHLWSNAKGKLIAASADKLDDGKGIEPVFTASTRDMREAIKEMMVWRVSRKLMKRN